jgi:hypothetical protein
VFQGTLMAVASTLVFGSVLSIGGGMSGLSHAILPTDAAFLGPWGKLTPLAALSFFFVFGMGSLGQPQAVHKYYMLRDVRQLKWYPLLKTVGQIVVLLLFFGVGVGVKALVDVRPHAAAGAPRRRDTVVPAAVHPRAAGRAGVRRRRGGDDGRVNSFINIGAAAVTHDLPMRLRPPAAQRAAMGAGRDARDRGRRGRDRAVLGRAGGLPGRVRLGAVRVDHRARAGRRLNWEGADARWRARPRSRPGSGSR